VCACVRERVRMCDVVEPSYHYLVYIKLVWTVFNGIVAEWKFISYISYKL